jgi:hypothetical protein
MIFRLETNRGSQRSPADHRSESRLSIPRRGALQRSSSPLPQPSSILKRTVEFVEKYSSNGQCLILRPSQRWGSPHSVQEIIATNSKTAAKLYLRQRRGTRSF